MYMGYILIGMKDVGYNLEYEASTCRITSQINIFGINTRGTDEIVKTIDDLT
jgi:hypothetical protein